MKKACMAFVLLSLVCTSAFAQRFKVSYPEDILNEPFTGKVFLFLSKIHRNPKDAQIGLELFPCYAVQAKGIKPGGAVTFDDHATSFPVSLSDLERGEYSVQAIWDRNLGGRSIATSPGNIYSQAIQVTLTKNTKKVFKIECNQIMPALAFVETDLVKELKVPSRLLSDFHHRAVTIDAAVLLPDEYLTEPDRKFPVLFFVFGFGGDYHVHSGTRGEKMRLPHSTPCIRVYLDGNCPLGHAVYANSENNGPWGDSLVEEFIPSLEKRFRCNGARLLTGHSSGGWSVLWLQTHYPKIFAGCWSSAPDPVDFRSFLNVDLYTEKNLFVDNHGELRPLAVIGRFPWIYLRDVYRMESVICRGEQQHSFEAVFSEKGGDGRPESLCNPETGEINPGIVAQWKKYDIALYLKREWDRIKEDLDGKVRISVGEGDNWHLYLSVHLLEEEMKKLGSTFQFAYYPGDHFILSSSRYREGGEQFLEQKYREWLEKNTGNEK
ncbi:esterase family protein [bacterium]|nr:esterase family protein [bacterium]